MKTKVQLNDMELNQIAGGEQYKIVRVSTQGSGKYSYTRYSFDGTKREFDTIMSGGSVDSLNVHISISHGTFTGDAALAKLTDIWKKRDYTIVMC